MTQVLKSRYYIPLLLFTIGTLLCIPDAAYSQGAKGYYRYPAVYKDLIVFSAEGDLWSVNITGGPARRLTTHPGEETNPIISPDGKQIAFTANYEGVPDVYTMPIDGGLPKRWTYENDASIATAWTPDGDLVYTSRHYSTLPNLQLIRIDKSGKKMRIPLAEASEASYNSDGKTIFFVRPSDHRNVTKRYKGGTARRIWKYTQGAAEAIDLSDDYRGESHHPTWYNNRVYFITDRDSIMNVWSMDENGKDLKQHTRQTVHDVRSVSVSDGKIVYHSGADLWLHDLSTGQDKVIPITLTSDFDQLREKWVKDPRQYITSVHLDSKGEKIVITARGRIFVAPAKEGRFAQLSRKEGVRYRDAVFNSTGNDVITLSDESGEFEFVQMAATGTGPQKALTNDGKVLRFAASPSPDGKWIAYPDLNSDLWLFNMETKKQKLISTNREGIQDISWSPDSRWIAYTQNAVNTFAQIHLYDVTTGAYIPLTTDRANSLNPSWSSDGKWIYFLSDRNFQSLVGSPWGPRQPEPYFDKQMKIYHIALQKGTRSPFQPDDELQQGSNDAKDDPKKDNVKVVVNINPDGIQQRIKEVPVKPGNYSGLAVNDKALYFMSDETGLDGKTHLMALPIQNKDIKPVTLVEDIRRFEISGNGKKLLINKDKEYYVTDAGTSPITKINDNKIDLKSWTFSLDPREDFKQIFKDAWRMERDYFYDPAMHGVDWIAAYKKYLPLVDRITTREELSDIIGHYVGELEALHTSVRGGDLREGPDEIEIAGLGARMVRDEARKGYVIEYIYQADPDYPDKISPLADPYLGIKQGDVISHINGEPTLSYIDIGALLRNQANKQVRLGILSNGTSRDVIITPTDNEFSLRYSDWEFTRRMEVEKLADGKIGYVHLRAMGSNDISQWYREFYPVFNRQGLIIDARSNNGGNIDSFILEKLMRQAWFYFKPRVGNPSWNMQYAFRGHMVVLVDQHTASDGEAFADGFRRLGLGKVIGMRTWGGEIWLGSQNRLSDGGLARAPMMGVYGPERKWLIEGHGLVPDIEVDNLPHATFEGKDAQLDAGIEYLLELIKKDPREVPAPPPFPDKAYKK